MTIIKVTSISIVNSLQPPALSVCLVLQSPIRIIGYSFLVYYVKNYVSLFKRSTSKHLLYFLSFSLQDKQNFTIFINSLRSAVWSPWTLTYLYLLTLNSIAHYYNVSPGYAFPCFLTILKFDSLRWCESELRMRWVSLENGVSQARELCVPDLRKEWVKLEWSEPDLKMEWDRLENGVSQAWEFCETDLITEWVRLDNCVCQIENGVSQA